jgi:hypothetical protein
MRLLAGADDLMRTHAEMVLATTKFDDRKIAKLRH